MTFPYLAGNETLYVAGYSLFLLLVSAAMELGARFTHRHVRMSKTTGFRYLDHLDAWVCSRGRHLWLHRRDPAMQVTYYRADAQDCNSCPVKQHCTDSKEGRELVSAESRWPHSEIERFQRGISLILVVLALFITVIELGRHHTTGDTTVLAPVVMVTLIMGIRTLNKFTRWKGEES
jgi:hypothetical protein